MAASFSILFLLITFSIRFSHADPRLDIVARSCKPPDKLYVLSQCMDDLSNLECAQCFARIGNLLPGCFPATGGRVYLDGCFIRANNYSFYQEIIAEGDMKRCSDDVDTNQDFQRLLRDVLQKIVYKAPNNGGFGLAHETKNGATIHGLAQCWRILDKDMCSACLIDAVNSAFNFMPSQEGRALNAGCFLRYSTYEFANDPDAGSIRYAIISFISYTFFTVAICTLAIAVGFCLGKLAYRQMNSGHKPKGKELDHLAAMNQAMQFLQFKFSTLERATDCFNEAQKLGSGGYGEVFKGTLPDGREIEIKRLYINGKSRSQEIYNEMDVISRAQHKNLVRFLGGCFTTIENFLVYEYLVNKSLDSIIFDPEKKKELDWGKRHRIIIGTAEGLEYLHKGCEVQIIHRDIKASNILLDLKYRPKIADFGLARLCWSESDMNSLVNSSVAGTFGYMAPEYIAKGRLTEKVDVYSFGVLVLEIISGVKNTKIKSEIFFDTLVTDAWKHFQSNTTSKIIDESLGSEDVEEIKREIQLGLLCTQAKPALRPSITKVLQMLRHKDMELPIPTKPPFLDEFVDSSSSFGFNIPGKSPVYNSHRNEDL
ncbi:hypothetical protein CRYUN_Cryun24cG0112200 [Craigia yunnanensis]